MVDRRTELLGGAFDKLWKKITLSDILHSEDPGKAYIDAMTGCGQAAAVAAEGNNPKLNDILEQWDKVQKGYAKHVREQVLAGEKVISSKLVEVETDLKGLEGDKKKFNELQAAYQQNGYVKGIFKKLAALEDSIDMILDLESQQKECNTALAGIRLATDELLQLQTLKDHRSVDYLIPPAAEIMAALKKGTYEGPIFEAFFRDSKDIFLRGDKRKSLPTSLLNGRTAHKEASELPRELEALLTLKHYVDSLEPGKKFNSKKAWGAMGENYLYAPKGIGGILERGAHIFGLSCERTVGRWYTRKAGKTISNREFIDYVIGNILGAKSKERIFGPQEIGSINEFYIRRALDELRDEYIGYAGFRFSDIAAKVDSYGYKMTRQLLGANFKGGRREKFDVRIIEDSNPKEPVYAFATPKPNDRQTELARKAIPDLGFGQITAETLCDYVLRENKYKLHPLVGTHLLGELSREFNLKEISPGVYQRIDRPDTLGRAAKEARSVPGSEQSV